MVARKFDMAKLCAHLVEGWRDSVREKGAVRRAEEPAMTPLA
jgi:hypothetical protein